jgi:CheY-like chemotaxis protein
MESTITTLSREVREAIHNITGLIALTSQEPLSKQQSLYLAGCRETADRLRRSADDLVELGRPAIRRALTAFEPAAAIREVVDLMAMLALQKGLTFDVAIEPSIPARIYGDKTLVQDTLRRILDNAIRFTPSGGIHLAVTWTVQTVGAVLRLDVSDTGPGIDIVTDPESASVELPSDWVGLRIVQKRLRAVGGGFSVPTSGPSGTTVRFTTPPWTVAPHRQLALETDFAGYAVGPKLVLVAEDSDESYALFDNYTRDEGYRITRARDGAEAVESAKSGTFDLIVMDANMPKMDGYAATAAIREWETARQRARLPILLFSADDEERQIFRGAEVGCSGYLTKPATKTQVLAALSFYDSSRQNRANWGPGIDPGWEQTRHPA